MYCEVNVLDKYELNIKIEKLDKLVKNRDYVNAAKVADQLEWKKMKQWSVMSNAIDAFIATGEYEKARNVCIYAYNRNLGGRRLLATLMEMYIKLGEYEDAQEIYDEYVELAPRDLTGLILLYKLKRAQGAPVEELITILQNYKEKELDEQYEFELAMLYSKAGLTDKCVRECDELVLWFSEGVYVEKALKLKQMYAPLTPRQEAKLAMLEKMSAAEDKKEKSERNMAYVQAAAAKEPEISNEEVEEEPEYDKSYYDDEYEPPAPKQTYKFKKPYYQAPKFRYDKEKSFAAFGQKPESSDGGDDSGYSNYGVNTQNANNSSTYDNNDGNNNVVDSEDSSYSNYNNSGRNINNSKDGTNSKNVIGGRDVVNNGNGISGKSARDNNDDIYSEDDDYSNYNVNSKNGIGGRDVVNNDNGISSKSTKNDNNDIDSQQDDYNNYDTNSDNGRYSRYDYEGDEEGYDEDEERRAVYEAAKKDKKPLLFGRGVSASDKPSAKSSGNTDEKRKDYIDDIGNTTQWTPIDPDKLEVPQEKVDALPDSQPEPDYDININVPDYSVYDTRNVQQELKANVNEIMEAYHNREKKDALREAVQIDDVEEDSDPTKEIIINKHQWRKASRNIQPAPVAAGGDVKPVGQPIKAEVKKPEVGRDALAGLRSDNIREVTSQMTLEQMSELVAQLQAEQERRKRETEAKNASNSGKMDISKWISDTDDKNVRRDTPEEPVMNRATREIPVKEIRHELETRHEEHVAETQKPQNRIVSDAMQPISEPVAEVEEIKPEPKFEIEEEVKKEVNSKPFVKEEKETEPKPKFEIEEEAKEEVKTKPFVKEEKETEPKPKFEIEEEAKEEVKTKSFVRVQKEPEPKPKFEIEEKVKEEVNSKPDFKTTEEVRLEFEPINAVKETAAAKPVNNSWRDDAEKVEREELNRTVREIAASFQSYGGKEDDEFEEIPDVDDDIKDIEPDYDRSEPEMDEDMYAWQDDDDDFDDMDDGSNFDDDDDLPDIEKAINAGIEQIIDDNSKAASANSGRYLLREEERAFLDKYLYMSGMEKRLCKYIGAKRAEMAGKIENAGDIAIMGSRSTDKIAFAVNLFKAIHAYDTNREQKLARISADRINERGYEAYADKLVGQTLVVENAGRLKRESLASMIKLRQGTLFVIVDEEFEINKLFTENPDFAEQFTGRFLLKQYTVNELVDIAKDYAEGKNWRVEDKALLKLYLILGQVPNDDQGNVVDLVKDIMEHAAKHAGNRLGNKLFARFRNVLVIKEGDLKSDDDYEDDEDEYDEEVLPEDDENYDEGADYEDEYDDDYDDDDYDE